MNALGKISWVALGLLVIAYLALIIIAKDSFPNPMIFYTLIGLGVVAALIIARAIKSIFITGD